MRFFSLTVSFFFLFAASANATDHAKYATFLIELSEGVNSKEMVKRFRKKRLDDWKKEVKASGTIDQLKKLTLELEEGIEEDVKQESVIEWRHDIKEVKTYPEYGKVLVTLALDVFEAAVEEEFTGSDWSDQVRNYNIALEDRLQQEKRAKQKVRFNEEEFEKFFLQLWKASRSSFKEVRGEKKDGVNLALINLPEAEYGYVLTDDSGILSYKAVFDAGEYEENAQKLVNLLMEATLKYIPEEGFNRYDEYFGGYLDGMSFLIEFRGEKFAETAKKPTVRIGARKNEEGSYQVEYTLAEPVFKRR